MVEKQLGLNQSVARKMNNNLAINEFRKNPISGTELSEILHLSNATSSSIIKSLLSKNIIRVDSSDSVSGVGRKRLKYTINEKFGLILVISLTSYRLHTVLADINSNTLYESESEISEYNFATLKNAVDTTKDLLEKPQFNGMSLKCVIISLPGLINKKTGELQVGPQFSQDLFSNKNQLITYPQEVLGCPVYLENDSKLMMLAELSSGEFSKVESGMLAYIDYGVGGAFEFNNKIYFGSRGYSGEIGRLRVDFDDIHSHLDDVASIRVMKEEIAKVTGKILKTAEIVELFKNGDELVKSLVLRSAKALGIVIKEVIRVFDIEQFTVSGRVSQFGDTYLNEVKRQIIKENPDAIVRYSKIDSSAIIEGAKAMAANIVIQEALENL